MAPSSETVIGVDIGGTKTRILEVPLDSRHDAPVLDITVPTSSWRGGLGNARRDADGLRALLTRNVGAHALDAALAAGVHGCDNTRQCQELEEALRSRFAGPVVVVNDSELLAPAMRHPEAINLVVGTGAIATARSSDGRLMTSGGWGWLLGDEGSAPALVREASRAVLAELDRGGESDPLARRLMAAFAARDAAEFALAVTVAASATAWGDHAPEVFLAAEEGSSLAAAVIQAAGEQLALLVVQLRQRGIHTASAVAAGSVIERQPRLQDAVRAALARQQPAIELLILDVPPVAGAAELARRVAAQTTNHPNRTEKART
jgi:N-acetylglucosamine kinase-like BadF-type ATPase